LVIDELGVGVEAGAEEEEDDDDDEVLPLSCPLPGVSAVSLGVPVELAGGTRVIVTPLIEVVVLCGAEPLVLGVEPFVFVVPCGVVETLFGL
jgi:hypothetical protein